MYGYEENPWEAQCGRAYPPGHRLTAADKQALPDAAFGLIRRGVPPYRRRGYPMPDAVHAANAKARATKAYNEGFLTRGQYVRITRKADEILERCGGILAPVTRLKRRRVAANPRPDVDRILEAASAHGESSDDPDHEIGDLQDALIAAFEIMAPSQRRRLFQNDRVRSILEWE